MKVRGDQVFIINQEMMVTLHDALTELNVSEVNPTIILEASRDTMHSSPHYAMHNLSMEKVERNVGLQNDKVMQHRRVWGKPLSLLDNER